MPLNTTVITTVIALGVLVLDHILLFPRELGLYRRKSGRPAASTTLLSFILVRYSGLLASISLLLFATIPSNHCQTLIIVNQIFSLLTVVASGGIFFNAAMSKWDGNKLIAGLIGVLYIAMIACSCVTAAQVHSAYNDKLSWCEIQPFDTLSALGYAASFFFDASVLVSLFMKRNNTVPYPATPCNVKSSIAFVGIATIVSLFFTVTHAMGTKRILVESIKVGSQPFASVILVISGAHVFINQVASDSRGLGLPFYSQNNGRPQSLNTLSVLNVGRQTPTILITPATAAGRDVSMKSHLTGAPSEARPDTPFSSYDYDSDSDEKNVKDGKNAYITRETVISFD